MMKMYLNSETVSRDGPIVVTSYSKMLKALNDPASFGKAIEVDPLMVFNGLLPGKSPLNGDKRNFKVIKVGKQFVLIDHKNCITGTYAKVFGAYTLSKENERYRLEPQPRVVRKIKKEKAEYESPQFSQYFPFFGGIQIKEGKNSYYQVFERYSSFDLDQWLRAWEGNLHPDLITDKMQGCDWNGACLLPPPYFRSDNVFKEEQDSVKLFQQAGDLFNRLTLSTRFDLIIKILQEVKRIHEGGERGELPLLHRDLKPSNIMVDLGENSDGDVFVKSVHIIDPGFVEKLNKDGFVIVKGVKDGVSFASPEALIDLKDHISEHGERKLTKASDLYSLASIFALVCGANESCLYAWRDNAASLLDLKQENSAKRYIRMGYDFSDVFSNGMCSFRSDEEKIIIQSTMQNVLKRMISEYVGERPTSDQLIEFFKQFCDILLKMENKDPDANIDTLCSTLRNSIQPQRSYRPN